MKALWMRVLMGICVVGLVLSSVACSEKAADPAPADAPAAGAEEPADDGGRR